MFLQFLCCTAFAVLPPLSPSSIFRSFAHCIFLGMEGFPAIFAHLPRRPFVWLVVCQANLCVCWVDCAFISGCASLGLFVLLYCLDDFRLHLKINKTQFSGTPCNKKKLFFFSAPKR